MSKLTKRTVDAAKPQDRDYFIWDDELPSFGLRVFPSSRRSYVVQYRVAGRTRRYTIGPHGRLTADEARKKAKRLLADITDGGDPSGSRRHKRNLPTISALCDRYITEHLPTNKASTAKEFERLIEKRVRPALGSVRVDSIARPDVRAWHNEMRAIPYEGNRALAVLSKMLSLAVNDWEVMKVNPCLGLKRHPEKMRSRYFSDDEFRRIGAAIDSAEETLALSRGVVMAVRLLALTGLRAGEVLSLWWSDVDLQHGALHLRDTKTGTRTVSIGALTVALLSEFDRTGEWVVSGANPENPLPISTLEKGWAWLRDRAGLADARLHDFRHSIGTLAAQTGANAFMVRDKLGHRTLAMTGRYVERDTDQLRQLSDQVESRVAAAMSGRMADVEKMPARQKG